MWSNFAYYATLGFESLVGIFGIRLYEEPRYDIVGRLGDHVEIRSYAPRLAAEVELSGAGEANRGQAFRLLFAYISGANQAQNGGSAKIAMTAPVEVRSTEKLAMTVPVQVSETNDLVRMVFYLPASISADAAPKPVDGRVRIVTAPSETIATLRFSGSSDGAAGRQLELIAALKGSRWNPTGAPYMLSYDPPFALPFLRRNEAAVAVAEAR